MKIVIMMLMAGVMGLGLVGCGDSDSCYSVANCSGSPGYGCDASYPTCYSTKSQCQSSGKCN